MNRKIDLIYIDAGGGHRAAAMRLPVIAERNSWTLAHERFNGDWIEAERIGIVVSGFSRIGEAVGQLLEPQRYREFRANAAARVNPAVYEIPAMLAEILEPRLRVAPAAPGAAAPVSGSSARTHSAIAG